MVPLSKTRLLTGLILIAMAGFLVWPSPIDPVRWDVPPAPLLTGKLAPNTALQGAETLGQNQIEASEDLVPDTQGVLYFSNGAALSRWHQGRLETVAHLGGQNLGLAWLTPQTLLVANQPLGIFAVDIRDGQVKPLVQGTIHYPNAMAVSRDHTTLYFSDSSSRFYGEPWKYLYDLLEARPHGRLYALNLKTGQLTVLLDKLYYANGVTLSTDESAVLVNETYRYRIRRVVLKGPMAGQNNLFAENLPGFPDGLALDPQTGGYWVALVTPRNPIVDWLHGHPWLKSLVPKLPRSLWPKPRRYGMVLRLNHTGQVTECLQDPTGRIGSISTVRRVGNTLYLGSLSGHYAGRLNLDQLP